MAIYQEYAAKKISIKDELQNEFNSVEEFWRKELDPAYVEMEKTDAEAKEMALKCERVGTKEKWYGLGESYWDQQTTDINGVLGGYGKYHDMESSTSEKIFKPFLDKLPAKGAALEAGGGIGRISKRILNPLGFELIDLQDQSSAQFEQAKINAPCI